MRIVTRATEYTDSYARACVYETNTRMLVFLDWLGDSDTFKTDVQAVEVGRRNSNNGKNTLQGFRKNTL